MEIIIGIIWTILSMYAIDYTDRYVYWKHLHTVLIITIILAFIFNAWQIYDPNQNHMIATIEINPTWEAALLTACVEGICITGPIAAIYTLKEKIKERRG